MPLGHGMAELWGLSVCQTNSKLSEKTLPQGHNLVSGQLGTQCPCLPSTAAHRCVYISHMHKPQSYYKHKYTQNRKFIYINWRMKWCLFCLAQTLIFGELNILQYTHKKQFSHVNHHQCCMKFSEQQAETNTLVKVKICVRSVLLKCTKFYVII